MIKKLKRLFCLHWFKRLDDEKWWKNDDLSSYESRQKCLRCGYVYEFYATSYTFFYVLCVVILGIVGFIWIF